MAVDSKSTLAGENPNGLHDPACQIRGAARKEKARNAESPAVRRLAPSADAKSVHAWTAENGVEVKSRGRVREDVVRRYLATLGWMWVLIPQGPDRRHSSLVREHEGRMAR